MNESAGDALAREMSGAPPPAPPKPAPTPAMPNDLGQNYLTYRSNLSSQTAGDELAREMMQQQATPEPTGKPTGGAGQPPSGGSGPPPVDKVGEGVGGAAHGLATAAGDIGKLALKANTAVGQTMSNVGGDILAGGRELPRALYTGPRAATANLYDRADDASKWAMQQLGIKNQGLFRIPGMDPNEMVSDSVRKWIDKRYIEDPKSVTGQLAQGVAQFVFGKALLGGGVPGIVGAGGLAFDPHSENLANLVEKFPVLKKPLIQALATNPEDSTLAGVAKNTIANLIGWPLTEGLMKVARMLGGALPAGPAASHLETAVAERIPRPNAFAILGDEKADPAAPILKEKPPIENDIPHKEILPSPIDVAQQLTGQQEGGGGEGEEGAAAARAAGAALPAHSNAELAAKIKEDGGFTYQPTTHDAPKPGDPVLSVSPYPEREQILHRDDLTPQMLGDYIDKNKDLLSKPDHYFGAWHDTESGNIFLDTTILAHSPEEAIEIGRQHNQIAAFDFKTMSTVDIRPERRAELANGEAATAAAGQAGTEVAGEHGGPLGPGQPAEAIREPQGQAGDQSGAGGAGGAGGPALGREGVAPAELSDEELLGRVDQHLNALEQGAPPQIPSSAAGRAMTPPQTYINFARIDSPTDVQRTLQEIADARAAPKDQARAGVMTFADMKASADQQNAWNILRGRREGDPLSAPQITAARQLWLSSGAKMVEVARTAQAAPTPENLFALRKMMEVHGWISDQVTGAVTSAARSVASMRIPVGPEEGRLQEISDRLDAVAGGADNVKDMADRIVSLADSSDPGAAQALQLFAEKSVGAKTRDGIIQIFRDALLSSPVTQGRILASNVSTIMLRLVERKAGEATSQLLGTEGGIAPGEAAAMYNGWIGSFRDAMAYGWKAAQTGVTGAGIGDVPHEQFPSKFSADAFGLKPGGTAGRVADFVGQAASWGFGLGGRRMIVAQHDMALTMSYGASLHANALRQALSEVSAGELSQDGVTARIASLLRGPDGMPDPTIAAAARAEAKYGAFLDQPGNDTIGKLTNVLMSARREIPELNMIIPFIKIPSRILSFTLERTPLAPLMSDFRSKVAQGGATRDLALAQLAVGTMVTSAAADMVYSGQLKGGGPPERGLEQAEEREGKKRDSIKIGDTWYNINGVHPIGKMILLAADTAEAVKGGQNQLKNDDETQNIVAGTALSIARTLTNASYTQALSNFFATIHDANVKNEGKQGERALQSIVGEAVPQAVAASARGLDPYQRAVYTMLDEFKSKIPGLSKSLSPERDLWGDPVSAGHDPLSRFASPVRFQKETHSPIDDEILRLGANITQPERYQTFGGGGGQPGARIDMAQHPKEFSRFQQLAGNEYKDPAYGDVGAKDALNAIVSGNHPLSPIYNMKSDSGKTEMIRGIVNHYREGARGALMEENPRLSNEVQQVQQQMQALRMPQ